jgi:hypothetical protein
MTVSNPRHRRLESGEEGSDAVESKTRRLLEAVPDDGTWAEE